MSNRGRMIYVPPVIIEEVYKIMQQEELHQRTEAFRKMAKYSQLGRDVNKTLLIGLPKEKKKKEDERWVKSFIGEI